ncbi:MAG: AAA family ATPase [Flavobacteriales bacterium]|nr:AAA family ATPase [Bacteroidota bacterium]MCB9240618.1 AAA family ATPase [Flavobacteriales bacterium]
MKQEKALAILKSGRNVFLTGSAGTGKTYVLNQYIQFLQERNIPVAITASTGIAATHMNGQTIHSWSGMGVKDVLTASVMRNLLEKKYLRKNIDTAKVLIIDEISMLHRKQLDMVDEILQMFRENPTAFGGIQLVLSGDFFQLPPVTKDEETNREKFAFMAKAWVDAQLHVCYLTEQYRQTDDDLNDLLNEIRAGSVSTEKLRILDDAVYNRFKFDPTRLYSHNFDVDRLNDQELQTIAGEPIEYTAKTKGQEPLIELLRKSVLAPDVLYLKEGAQVMFVRNNYDKQVMNGTLGTVVGFTEEEDYPIVKTVNGRTVTAEPEIWDMTDERGKTLASYAQIPLRLAWAITVHKSQGMTLDAAEIDLTKTFEKGQGYVALSRLKSVSGLRLLGYNELALEVDELALKADIRFQQLSKQLDDATDLNVLSEEADRFVRRCGGLTSPADIRKHQRKKEAKRSGKSTYDQTRELYLQGLSIEAIAKEREMTTGTIIGHLVTLKDKGLELDMAKFVGDIRNLDTMQAAYEALQVKNRPEDFYEDGKTVRSKALFDALKGKVSYEQINLFKLVFN